MMCLKRPCPIRGRSDIAILVTAPSTMEATGGLFKTCRDVLGAESIGVETILLPEVWDIFLAGDLEGYKKACVTALDTFLENDDKIHPCGGWSGINCTVSGLLQISACPEGDVCIECNARLSALSLSLRGEGLRQRARQTSSE